MFFKTRIQGEKGGCVFLYFRRKCTILDNPGLLLKVVDVNMTSFQHVPVCGFFELYNLFDTVTFQTAYICRLTDNQICETKDLLSFDRNSVLLCVS